MLHFIRRNPRHCFDERLHSVFIVSCIPIWWKADAFKASVGVETTMEMEVAAIGAFVNVGNSISV
jgi:hypothetical protein